MLEVPRLPLVSFFIVLLSGSSALATSRAVPFQYPTIQSAIDASFDGDTVVVAPGTYLENIDFLGKAITVMSTSGPEVTSIVASTLGSVVVFRNGEPRESVLDGFTIRGGTGTCVLFGPEVPTSGVYGGGILVIGCTPTISGNIITHNEVSPAVQCNASRWIGAGICVAGLESNPLIVGNRIDFNTTTGDRDPVSISKGGGIGIRTGASAEILDNVISDNSVTNGSQLDGGGIDVYTDANPLIEGNLIVRNAAQRGGGISMYTCTGVVRSNVIRDNHSTSVGGGVWNIKSASTIEDNDIVGNSSPTGGGMYIALTEMGHTVSGNRIFDNTATSLDGGGIYLEGATLLERNHIVGNFAAQFGGGLFTRGPVSGERRTRGNVYAFNEASNAGGGVFMQTPHDLVNETVYGNTAGSSGGGIYVLAFNASMTNTIVWGNTAPQYPAVTDFTAFPGAYCNVEGGYPGIGNIDEDPKLVDPVGGDFRLPTSSPCIDRGSNSAAELPPTDYEGDARILDGDLNAIAIVDIGADEVNLGVASRFGSVNAGVGPIANVLRINGTSGDERRELSVAGGEPIACDMLLPPAGGSGKYVVHVNDGSPSLSTVVRLPGGVGMSGFELLLTRGAMPLAIYNGVGKPQTLGTSVDFDGTPIPNPAPAPSVFFQRPLGDPIYLPVGTTITFHGAILDPGTAGTKPASATNAVVLTIE